MRLLDRFQRPGLLRGVALTAALTVGLAACDDDDDNGMTPPEQTIVEVAAATPSTSTLVTALQAADLTGALSGDGPFTVFAPVNQAFNNLPAGELDRLLQPGNQAELAQILQLHVVPQRLEAADLQDGQSLTTLEGSSLQVSTAGGVSVNGATVITADVQASNGVIHLIDEVILPPQPSIAALAAGTSDLSTLVAALQAAGLVSTLEGDGPFTVFAPANSAFDALGQGTVDNLLASGNEAILSDLLTYHVVAGAALTSDQITGSQTVETVEGASVNVRRAGGGVQVDGATVTTADIRAGNGVIHIVDGVLTGGVDVVELASVTPDLETLVAAIGAADGVAGALQGEGPFTVFAPVDEAFANLTDDQLDFLLAPENQDLLTSVLTYHVVPGDLRASDLRDGQVLETLQGEQIEIDLSDGARVNGAEIVATDIGVSNGVIHLIGGVLTGNLDIVDQARFQGLDELVTAAADAGLAETLRTDNEGQGFTVFAPTDAAFQALEADPSLALADILLFHVRSGEVPASLLFDGRSLETLEGGNLEVQVDASDGTVTVGGQRNRAEVVVRNVRSSNGIVHVIDAVLLPGPPSIVEIATSTDATSTLAAALAAGDLVSALEADGPFTVFAPVNSAFDALPSDQLDRLLDPENQALLQKVLTYHVVPGERLKRDFLRGQMLETLEGSTVTLDPLAVSGPMVNDATIIQPDVQASNGVVHLIDQVLTENLDLVDVATLQGASTLVAAVEAAELVETLRSDNDGEGFTVFAPVNSAFADLPPEQLDRLLDPANQGLLQKVLTYHVIPGQVRAGDLVDGQTVTTVEGAEVTIDLDGGPSVNGADIIATDIETANGVIHLIDGVLTENLDVVDVATLNGFETLVGAVQTAGLEATLRTDNGGVGFTVFAPTDEAFAALDAIPTDPSVLADILLYHVVGATVESGDLSDEQVVTTLQGGTFTVDLDGGVFIEGAQNTVEVVLTDVPAENGVIHVIDAVLLPPA
jgi:uncharacterized surface protein with fasciclin (FAS1) repeats